MTKILPFPSAAPNGIGRATATSDGRLRIELLPVVGGWRPAQIVPGPVLGHGRAAQARLVEAIGAAQGESILAVEKTFRPGLLTRFIYRVAFQAPFAYQHSRDAILACYYRRRVAAAIISATTPGVRVAMPLYVRYDRKAQAWVLGAEFIRGRGVRPAPADPTMLRGWVSRRLWGRSADRRRRDEMAELLQVMRALEWVFRKSGLVGAGWQVCPRALVSTANLLRTDDGYVVVDLESGIPAVAVGRYVIDGLRIGSPPLFDDVDAGRMSRWLDSRRPELIAHLGMGGYDSLCEDVAHLVHHTRRWKKSEFALLRNRTSLASPRFRQRFKARLVETWLRRDIIDRESAERMRPGSRIFSRPTFLLGLVPGRLGRFLQRCCAHRFYRAQVGRFVRDSIYRRGVLHAAVEHHLQKWREAGRISPGLRMSGVSGLFLMHFFLRCVTPAKVHRWLADPAHRRDVMERIYLLCVSSHFQGAYGRHVIGEMIRRWKRDGRIGHREAESLQRQLGASELDEYVRCTGMHVGLKLFLPLLAPLKVGGLAASLATGNPLYLLPIAIMPTCRTAVTLWRMLHPARRHIRYVEALLVGPLPVIGVLAYPVQMRASHPELSELLMRDAASRIGRHLPIYGGKDSRVEFWAIKAVNLLLEAIDTLRLATRPFERLLAVRPATIKPRLETETISFRKWAKLEARQTAMLAESESTDTSDAEVTWTNWTERQTGARAA